MRSSPIPTKTVPALVLTVSLFALWGAGHRLYDTLGSRFSETVTLGTGYTWSASLLYLAIYMVGAIPAALCCLRFGYKAAILVGLCCVVVGCFIFYPAAGTRSAPYILFATSIMACGWITLEVAANPLVACMGPPETFVRRLNLAQAFYPAGSLIGIAMGRWLVDANLISPGARNTFAIGHPYILLGAGVLLLALLIDEIDFPAIASERNPGNLTSAFGGLLPQPMFLAAIAAQFFGVAALSSSWLLSLTEFRAAYPVEPQTFLGDPLVWAMLAFLAGRVTGYLLMRHHNPAHLLARFSLAGAAASAIGAIAGGLTSAIAMLATSFLISFSWPTVLAFAIEDKGKKMKPATAMMIVAGSLGGFCCHVLETGKPLVPVVGCAAVAAYAFLYVRSQRIASEGMNSSAGGSTLR